MRMFTVPYDRFTYKSTFLGVDPIMTSTCSPSERKKRTARKERGSRQHRARGSGIDKSKARAGQRGRRDRTQSFLQGRNANPIGKICRSGRFPGPRGHPNTKSTRPQCVRQCHHPAGCGAITVGGNGPCGGHRRTHSIACFWPKLAVGRHPSMPARMHRCIVQIGGPTKSRG